MTTRTELLKVTDDAIDDAVKFADPMVLRGLVYQLTGDESLTAMEAVVSPYANVFMEVLANEADVALVQDKAAAFLKSYRDQGAGDIPLDPEDRLPRSICMTTGVDLADSEMKLWIEILGLDPMVRGLKWRKKPNPEKLKTSGLLSPVQEWAGSMRPSY